jgi:hypothetical protein
MQTAQEKGKSARTDDAGAEPIDTTLLSIEKP